MNYHTLQPPKPPAEKRVKFEDALVKQANELRKNHELIDKFTRQQENYFESFHSLFKATGARKSFLAKLNMHVEK